MVLCQRCTPSSKEVEGGQMALLPLFRSFQLFPCFPFQKLNIFTVAVLAFGNKSCAG